ncbi:hypothetical protein QJS04_geneDACA003142 [Acorus gramineus]|uniref:Uncharacterized protein n=1 Tax=Acorus gramineus TaxID=55184 RepID=A0AAV9BUC9_ACOGR|nr:hypothetical protein QJS04_geneDACA003142 [Acorus gramineus]
MQPSDGVNVLHRPDPKHCGQESYVYGVGIDGSTVHERDRTAVRKLLLEELKEEVKVINATADNCAISNVVLHQGAAGTLPSGIPKYSVEILNVSPKNTTVMNVHIKCGWFASYNLVNPSIFRRLAHDDCLVNNGSKEIMQQGYRLVRDHMDEVTTDSGGQGD